MGQLAYEKGSLPLTKNSISSVVAFRHTLLRPVKADSHTCVQLNQIMDCVMLIITSGSQGRTQVGLDRRRHKVGVHTYSDVQTTYSDAQKQGYVCFPFMRQNPASNTVLGLECLAETVSL